MHRIDAALVFDGSLECETIESIIGAPGVPELEVTTLDATVTLHGDLAEDIMVTGNVNGNIEIEGDLSGDIDITGNLADEVLIRIEGSLTSTGNITMGTSGLIGQIIINAANGADTWDGDVIVGATTLATTPHYSNTGLGGGAVGEALFGFHKTDSVPAWDTTVTDAIPTVVKIVHYGPVHITTLGGGIIKVEKKDSIGGGWIDVSDDFIVDATISHTLFTRDIKVRPKVGEAYLDDHSYRLSVASSGKLLCSFVQNCPVECRDVDWQEDYFQFSIDLD